MNRYIQMNNLFLLLLDVDLVFLDNKKGILNFCGSAYLWAYFRDENQIKNCMGL